MSFLDIKNQAIEGYEGAKNNLGLGGERKRSKFYKDDFNDIYIGSSPNKNFSKSLKYGFRITDFNSQETVLEHVLQINPQTFQQDEEFSIQFFPTPQGITIEHQGSIMKDIVMSGVTGNHPRKGVGGVDKDGDVIFGTGNSGYKEFHDLRNFIRAYVEHKKDPKNSQMRLHFFNFKDQEFFVVEPTKFSLKRDRSRPFMYEYTIVLKTIGRFKEKVVELEGFSKILGNIDTVFDNVSNTIVVGRGILNGSVNLLTTVDREVRRKILDPLLQLELAIQDFRNGKEKVLNLPSKFMKDLKSQIRDISDKLANRSGVDVQGYNAFAGKSNTLIPSIPRTPTYDELRVLNTTRKIEGAISKITFNSEYLSQSTSDTIDSIEAAYGEVGFIKKSNSTKLIQILDGDTLHSISARELGDATRFQELVIANNLKYPYIAEDTGDGVLSYDDNILIPTTSLVDEGIIDVYRNIEYQITKSLSEAEKNLGVDLRLNKDKDLAITNTNDYDMLAGVPVVVQTIGTRLGVEKGSYKIHTSIGINLNVGQKNLFDAVLLREKIQQQLLDDSRIEKGSKVDINIDGNVIRVNVYANIKFLGQPYPIQLVSTG